MISQALPLELPSRALRWRVWGICLALAAITVAVFGQTLRHEFINYDDDNYVYDNPVVAQGLTLRGIIWAFNGVHAANWHPLTWLSHMLDFQLYGLHPGGHHLTNVLLHAATVIALFLVLRGMTGALWRSAFAAAVFAIHPLRVESVAWVAERKDVLSGLFFMLTIGAYVRFVRRPWSPARYSLVAFLFAMGLMCKPMLVTLPLLLLLLDYWPLQRMASQKISTLVVEKLPLLALSAALCAMTLVAQSGAIQPSELYSLPLRFGNALVACLIYLGQLVYPVGLAVFYPYPFGGLPAWEIGLAGTLLAGLSAVAWRWRRTQPWLLVGWLWYLMMLLPVLGIIQVGGQAHADRYTYLPQIGVCMAVTWLMAEWGAELRIGRAAVGGVMVAVLAVLTLCAGRQTAYWRTSETLWAHALDCTKGNDVAHYNLGVALDQEGRTDEAIAQYREVLKIKTSHMAARLNLATDLLEEGRTDESIVACQTGLQIEPDNAEFHNSLGDAFRQKGDVDEAISHFKQALQIRPDFAAAHNNLGSAFRQAGKVDEAIAHFDRALQLKPDYAEAHYNLGNALFQAGRLDEAIVHYRQAARIKAGFAAAHYNLGKALLQKGGTTEAVTHFQRVLEINPNYAGIHQSLGLAFFRLGRMGEAVSQYRKALQIAPADPSVQNNLAWILTTSPEASLRNGNDALDLARQADALAGGKNPVILRTLAAAFAETGHFSDAAETAQRALHLAEGWSNTVLTGQLQAQLKLYQAGIAYHVPAQKN